MNSDKVEFSEEFDPGYKVILKNVSYRSSKYSNFILKDINITVNPGEFVAIVGANAAGKSSLIKVIAGENGPIQGEVRIANQIVNRPVNQIINRVGIVHQFDDSDLIENVSIAQNIAIRQLLGAGHSAFLFATSKEWKRRIATLIGERAQIAAEDVNTLVKNLNGGARQMLSVVIAMHLEHERNPCRLLLLDEHTSKLDHINAEKIMKYTIKEVKRIKTTAIMVTHRYSDAINYTDRIIVIRDGRIFKEIVNLESISVQKLSEYVDGTEDE